MTVDGSATPKITWSKRSSLLPVGRHVVEPCGALIVRDVEPGDGAGAYFSKFPELFGPEKPVGKLQSACFESLIF